MKIDCPLMKDLIDDEICFDITMVAEGMSPERTIPKLVRDIQDYKQICLSCKFHKE